jgi:hypothetical protein
MTWAESATQALSSICGCCSPSAYTAMCLSPVVLEGVRGGWRPRPPGLGGAEAPRPEAPEAAPAASSSPICVTKPPSAYSL